MSESGVSEIIGSILLVSLVVGLMMVVTTVVISQPRPDNIPETTAAFSVINESGHYNVTITYLGGDALQSGEYLVVVNGKEVKQNSWPAFSAQSLPLMVPLDETYSPPFDVSLYYKGNSGSALLSKAIDLDEGSVGPSPAAPTVTSINPNSGPILGGTTVTIDGTNFQGATIVSFGGTPATYTVVSATQITATSPAHAIGTVDITVTTSNGTSATSSAAQYTYTATAAPTVTSINPNSGPILGGTTVTIYGTNFQGATVVSFGGTPATYTVVSATQITATSPAHSIGTVDITVTTPNGTSATSSADQYTYTATAAPTFTSITPNFGPTSGGTSVMIVGTNFVSGGPFGVTIGGVAATSVVWVNATHITAVTPAGTAGAQNVVITNNDGQTATGTGAFTYSAFVNFIIDENVFIYGNTLNFAGNTIAGHDATVIITGPLTTSDLNRNAYVDVTTIYIDGDVTLDGGSASLGSAIKPGDLYVNGDMTLGNGGRDIYGNVYIKGNCDLKDARIHGIVYVDGDLTLKWTPWLAPDARIYYTGTFTHPATLDPDLLAKCIYQATVPGFTMPDQPIPPAKSPEWYTAKGYVSSGPLKSNMKISADSYTYSSGGNNPATNTVIVARTGDIKLTGYGSGGVTGVLFAPNGKVTFDGGSFEGVVIARNGFFVTSGGTYVTFRNLANYFSNPDDYPF